MTKQKEIGYDVGNVAWHNLPGFEELWNKADFDTKELIVNEQGRIAFEKVLEHTGTNRDILTKFAIFILNNLKTGTSAQILVEEFLTDLKK